MPHRIAGLAQVFRPTAPEDLSTIGIEVVQHPISADIVTSGGPVGLAVRDRCTNAILAPTTVTAQALIDNVADAVSSTKVGPFGHLD